MKIFKILMLIVTGSTLFACGMGGTGTGNPKDASSGTAGMNVSYSAELLNSACTVLTACNPTLALADCLAGIEATSGFETVIGLPAGTYANFAAIMAAEATGSIAGNAVDSANCSLGIVSLSCSSGAVQNAYQSSQVNPFAQVPALIGAASASCGSVF